MQCGAALATPTSRFERLTIECPRLCRGIVTGLLRLLHRLGSISEAGTRVAEFKGTAEAGDIDSLIDAAYNAREVSVDFGMHGHSRNVRILTRITPFLNPTIQGWYKAARSGREQAMLTLMRGSVLTAFSLLLYLNNRDKEWYDDLEAWERNTYWHFDLGLRTADGAVIPLRIPKPFEWGAVFGSVPEGLAQVAIDRDGVRFAKRLQSVWNDVFALRVIPTALLVPAELWANQNSFTDRPIVSESKAHLDPALQYHAGTSFSAREIGAATGTSPAKVDHAIRGFFGTLGVYVTMLADQAVKQIGDYPEPPARTWRQMPVVKAFVHDPDSSSSRYVTEFYEALDKARRADASIKHLEPDQIDAYIAKHESELQGKTQMERAARDIAKERRDSERVVAARDQSADEKREAIAENNRMVRTIARGVMKPEGQGRP